MEGGLYVWNKHSICCSTINRNKCFIALHVLACVFSLPPDTGIQLQEEGEWSLCTRHHVIQDVVQRSEAFTINCRNWNSSCIFLITSHLYLFFIVKAASYLAPARVYPVPPSPPPPSLASSSQPIISPPSPPPPTLASSSRPSSESVPPPSPPPNSAQTDDSFSPGSIYFIWHL